MASRTEQSLREVEMQGINTKWIATVASIWIQCCSGATYTFGIYSSTLKSTQNYDQSTLDTVSVFKDIGANVGVLSGLLYSFVTFNHRSRLHFLRGPWVVLATGAILCFAGYFLMWASVVGLIHRPPVLLMCLFMFTAAHSQTFLNTGNVVTGVMNFGDYSGTIVGIMKGFLGLGGAALIQFYDTICKGNPSTFLLILALLPTLVSLLLMCLVRIYGIRSVDEKKHLNAFSAVAMTIAAYLMVIIILENIFTFPLWARILTFIILLLLLASPLRIAIKAQREDTVRSSQTFSTERSQLVDYPETMTSAKISTEQDPVVYHDLPGEASQVNTVFDDEVLKDEEDMNILQAMSTLNFWLLFIAMLCGMGSGLATVNNISQVGESLSYTTTEINSLVSLWSIWNFLGRFGGGYVSDIFLHRMGLERPLFIAITLATMSVGHIVVACGFPGNLYVGSVIVGVCYGCQWSLMPTITSEIFGVGHMGTIFNTIAIASPVGSYICSVRIIGYIYDKVSTGGSNSCYGTHCFMLSFFIMAFVAFFGCLVGFLLFFRTRRFYKQVVLRRLWHSSRT
ncbi:protein NUCLEAR FUSION DEFECTIVE 4-like [Melia azedarach]|uniref:Protein NUCLEAR FUSION DEFECTIVE 4-like n=1 Tax=Melia azedarach TaxID=155640 RepID=A0ACC1XMT4_MELAZ|nr:protein NUCLEAR FUSION DEFECTIVE 4-like [Melia azedarach]